MYHSLEPNDTAHMNQNLHGPNKINTHFFSIQDKLPAASHEKMTYKCLMRFWKVLRYYSAKGGIRTYI